MSNHFLKLAFSLIGIITAYTLLNVFFISTDTGRNMLIIVFIPIFTGILFYFISDRSIKYLSRGIDSFEIIIHNLSVYEIVAIVIGIIAGLVVANLVAIPFIRVDIIGIPIAVGLNILFGFWVFILL